MSSYIQKPYMSDYKYTSLPFPQNMRAYQQDLMLYEQQEQLKKQNELKEKQLRQQQEQLKLQEKQLRQQQLNNTKYNTHNNYIYDDFEDYDTPSNDSKTIQELNKTVKEQADKITKLELALKINNLSNMLNINQQSLLKFKDEYLNLEHVSDVDNMRKLVENFNKAIEYRNPHKNPDDMVSDIIDKTQLDIDKVNAEINILSSTLIDRILNKSKIKQLKCKIQDMLNDQKDKLNDINENKDQLLKVYNTSEELYNKKVNEARLAVQNALRENRRQQEYNVKDFLLFRKSHYNKEVEQELLTFIPNLDPVQYTKDLGTPEDYTNYIKAHIQ